MAKSTSPVRDTRAVTPDTSELLAAWERYMDALRQYHGMTRDQQQQTGEFEAIRVKKGTTS